MDVRRMDMVTLHDQLYLELFPEPESHSYVEVAAGVRYHCLALVFYVYNFMGSESTNLVSSY